MVVRQAAMTERSQVQILPIDGPLMAIFFLLQESFGAFFSSCCFVTLIFEEFVDPTQ